MNVGFDAHHAYFYEAIEPYDEGKSTDYRVLSKVVLSNQEFIDEWYLEVKENNERNHASVYESINEYEDAREKHKGSNAPLVGKYSSDGQIDSLYQRESKNNGKRNTQEGGGNKQGINYSLRIDNEEAIVNAESRDRLVALHNLSFESSVIL